MELFYESCPMCKNPGRSIRDLEGHFRCQTCGHDLADKRPQEARDRCEARMLRSILFLLFALILAAVLGGCGPTCIKAGGWGMNLEICWEGKQPPTAKNLKEGDDAEPDAPNSTANEGSAPTR